jgi:hypothetical protein
MYGGRSVDKGYPEMWVLSIPQFRWTKVSTSSIFTAHETSNFTDMDVS